MAAAPASSLGTAQESPRGTSPLKAVYDSVPRLSDDHSDDASILLVILSLFTPCEPVPLSLLHRGAAPQGRWNKEGGAEMTDATSADLAPELCGLLRDTPRLCNALDRLRRSSTVSMESAYAYVLEETARNHILERLSEDHISFWKSQALIIASRTISWKYLGPLTPDDKLFLSQLEHLLRAHEGRFGHLSVSTRIELAHTLVEASRFPGMAWKRFAISQAEVAASGLDDGYLRSCIAQAQCVLSRIAGNQYEAAQSLERISVSGQSMDKRVHSSTGKTAIQRALNYMQVENLYSATKAIEGWSSLNQCHSKMESTVLVRKGIILGRIMRFQGEFRRSLEHLDQAQRIMAQHKDMFYEDRRELTCELADTLRELDQTSSAEFLLRTEISQRDHRVHFSGISSLELSLAEVLFAQSLFAEAEKLCLEIKERTGLLKIEKLRLHITLAKLRHVQGLDALPSWNAALAETKKFRMTSGRTTRIIVLSICDILDPVENDQLLRASREEAAGLDELASPGGTHYWIAGLRHWRDFLLSRGTPSPI